MLYFVTIVLDGFPWLAHHLSQFERLSVPWMWLVAEGVADNVADTGWCKKIAPRLSLDGTSEYLHDLERCHPNVRVLHQLVWPGKTAMFNALLGFATKPGILMQIDSDELWRTEQIEKIVQLFDRYQQVDSMRFSCDYRVGPNLRCITKGAYGNNPGEWLRAWRYVPGVNFMRHEPPVYGGGPGCCLDVPHTEMEGLVFLHPAYATEKQVGFKMEYYGYKDAVEQWRRLQANTKWPAKLGDYLSWVKDGAMVDEVIIAP